MQHIPDQCHAKQFSLTGEWVLPWATSHPSKTFHENLLCIYCVILFTNKQTNKCWWKHNLLGWCNKQMLSKENYFLPRPHVTNKTTVYLSSTVYIYVQNNSAQLRHVFITQINSIFSYLYWQCTFKAAVGFCFYSACCSCLHAAWMYCKHVHSAL